MERSYRTPTSKEKSKLHKSREMMQRGIEGEGDFLSKISTTMAKAARDDQKMGRRMRESVPMEAREGEAYNEAGYKKGGKIKKYAKGGSIDGCAQRGKTKGRIV